MATRVHQTEQAAAPLEAPPALGLDYAEPADDAALEAVAAKRWRVALSLTGAMLVVYFGFILLIAFAKGFLAREITDGLSVGMALGVLVILATWALTWTYVLWANRVYEPALARLRR
ncbi:MAG: DUF485 domain-containing protein [Thermoleophilaceae bacterium]